MPPVEIYAVNFAKGNLTPHVDARGWGIMQAGAGTLGEGDVVDQSGDWAGLRLTLKRVSLPGSGKALAANGVYVVPPAGALLLESRLLLRVDFDSPSASDPTDTVNQPEPWAVALVVKEEHSPNNDLSEPFTAVTCQFNRRTAWDGARLNVVNEEQKDQAAALDGGVGYGRFLRRIHNFPFRWPVPFALEHWFCGRQSGAAAALPPHPPNIGHVAGLGALTIGKRRDWRAYSSTVLSGSARHTRVAGTSPVTSFTAPPASLGALGVSLATISGTGRMSVRLRRFSVSSWTPVGGTEPSGPEVEL